MQKEVKVTHQKEARTTLLTINEELTRLIIINCFKYQDSFNCFQSFLSVGLFYFINFEILFFLRDCKGIKVFQFFCAIRVTIDLYIWCSDNFLCFCMTTKINLATYLPTYLPTALKTSCLLWRMFSTLFTCCICHFIDIFDFSKRTNRYFLRLHYPKSCFV